MTKNKCGLPHHHGNDEERIISRLPSQETIDDVSILLKPVSYTHLTLPTNSLV